MNATVLRAGFLTTVQDLGRTGFRRLGVSLGGALDAHAMRVANLLVANDENSAGLETTMGTLRLRFADERLVAWCGDQFEVRMNDGPFPAGRVARIEANEELQMTAPQSGARAWLAISGGIDAPLVLGSRSTDLRGKFGGHEGRALKEGDTLPLGRSSAHADRLAESLRETRIAEWGVHAEWAGSARRAGFLRVVQGAQRDRFSADTHRKFVLEPFVVTAQSDRMGIRLEGPPLENSDQADLVSEAVAPGTIQVPPSGNPILLLGDCQTIGGYSKIAHVITVDMPVAAQLRPGHSIRFHEVSLAEAHQLLLGREDELARFRTGMQLRA
ncbi:MAG: biotin-dependent carboxyltransferase family protein [Chthoniobacterales bacterium]